MKVTPVVPVVNPDRAEMILTIGGQPRLVRYGTRFIKALSEQAGGEGPSDFLERLQTAPMGALIDMAVLAIQLSIPAAELPENFDAFEAIDDLPAAEQTQMYQRLLKSVTVNPIFAAFNGMNAA